jgi:hypothetical protein
MLSGRAPVELPGSHSHEVLQNRPSPLAAFAQVCLVGRIRSVRGFLDRRLSQFSELIVGSCQPEPVKSAPGHRSKAIGLGSGIVWIPLLRMLMTAVPAVILGAPQIHHGPCESAARHQPFLPQGELAVDGRRCRVCQGPAVLR